MSALTDSGAGVWSTGGNWNGGVAPVDGDTTIISLDKNLTGNATVGSSPSTAGTAAIKFGNVTGKTLDLASFRLIAKGDIDAGTNYNGSNTISLSAGARLTFLPPSAQQYAFRPNGSNKLNISATGTSGSHCTIDTDKSSSGLSSFTNNTASGGKFVGFNLAYTDVSDFGTSSQAGIACRVYGANSISITNTTFTRSNFVFEEATSSGNWSGTFTFTDNRFVSSVPMTGGSSRGVEFSVLSGMTGTLSILRNGFDDETVLFSDFTPEITFAHNAHAGLGFGATSTWTSDDNWHHNFAFLPAIFSGVTVYGPMRDCYLAVDKATNPFYFYGAGTTMSLTGCVWEATNASNDGDGDCNATANNGQTLSITEGIAVATYGTNTVAGTLLTLNTTSGGQDITIEHNTIVGTAFAAINYGEGAYSEADQLVSVKSNLFANLAAAGSSTFKIWDLGHQTTGGTQDVCSPTNADYNASLNYRLTPQVGNSYTNANNGYQGNFSAVPGTHDVTLTGGDPFVDSTGCLRTWGTSQGTDGSVTAARDLLRANPSLIAQATTGLMEWVRACYQVTDAALNGTAHGAGVIGAMGYVAPAASTWKRMDHRFLCPR